MTPFNKAQSAMEYMMTYGWAILIVIGVGVVLWQTGILNPASSTPPGKSGFSQITPLDWVASASSRNINLVLINDAGTRLNITAVNGTLLSGGTGNCPNGLTAAQEFVPAGTVNVNIFCAGLANAGEYYRAEISIDYTNPASGLSHKSVGNIWGAIE